MKIRNLLIAVAGVIVFVLLIVLAIREQSAYLLYAASAMPVVIVPFLPDLQTHQTIKVSTKDDRVRMFRLPANTYDKPEFVVIRFAPGVIKWHKSIVYFHLDEIPQQPLPAYKPEGASVSVLRHDLIAKRNKPNRYGIRLPQLAQRVSGFSFTTREIDRFVIRIADLQELRESATFSTATPARKNIEA